MANWLCVRISPEFNPFHATFRLATPFGKGREQLNSLCQCIRERNELDEAERMTNCFSLTFTFCMWQKSIVSLQCLKKNSNETAVARSTLFKKWKTVLEWCRFYSAIDAIIRAFSTLEKYYFSWLLCINQKIVYFANVHRKSCCLFFHIDLYLAWVRWNESASKRFVQLQCALCTGYDIVCHWLLLAHIRFTVRQNCVYDAFTKNLSSAK